MANETLGKGRREMFSIPMIDGKDMRVLAEGAWTLS